MNLTNNTQMDQIDSLYVINLRRRLDRLNGFLSALPSGWAAKTRILGAVDGANHELSVAEKHRLRSADWDIRIGRGQWGCSFSHEAVWREAISRKQNIILVLEDDARFTGTDEQLRQSIASMKTHGYDILFVGPSNHPENTAAKPHDFTNLVAPGIASMKSNLGTMSYLITGKGMTALLKIVEERGHYRAIDWIMNEYMLGSKAWIVSAPPLFKLEESAGSDIYHG